MAEGENITQTQVKQVNKAHPVQIVESALEKPTDLKTGLIDTKQAINSIKNRWSEPRELDQQELLERRFKVWLEFNNQLDSLVSRGELTTQEANSTRAQQYALAELNQRLDPKTKALSPIAFLEELSTAVDHSNTIKESLALLFFDLEDFKVLNDTYGHDAGDEILIGLTRYAKGVLSLGSHFGRFGGDEFLAAIPGKSQEEVLELVKQIQSSITLELTPIREKYGITNIGISVGAAFHKEGQTSEQLLKEADQLMYENKSQRKKGGTK